jgi:hypothetical protein
MIQARVLYKKLLMLYPKTFRERLTESMEQTFNDLCRERQETSQPFLLFMMSVFAETSISILQENLLVIKEMNPMKNILTNLGSSTVISLLLILPFMILEVVNRRNFNEDFPFALFFGLWASLFAINLILLPIVQARRTGNHDLTNLVPAQKNSLLTNPRSTLMISMLFILSIVILSFVASSGSNSEQTSVFGIQLTSQLMILILLSLPIAAGIIAGRPIVSTLRTGGSLFMHPIHLLIVVVISILFAAGIISLIVDQWPCFMGVPNCD